METTDRASQVNVTVNLPVICTKPQPQRRTTLVALRKAMGWTQENLAAAVGVQPNTVYRWESGRSKPALWLRDLLAEVLKISVLDLANLIDARPQPRPQEVRQKVHRRIYGRRPSVRGRRSGVVVRDCAFFAQA